MVWEVLLHAYREPPCLLVRWTILLQFCTKPQKARTPQLCIYAVAQLHASLEGYRPQVPLREQHLGLWSSVLNSLGGNDDNGSSVGQSQPTENTPRGIYMHGGVGTGKTFMMDLFFQVGRRRCILLGLYDVDRSGRASGRATSNAVLKSHTSSTS